MAARLIASFLIIAAAMGRAGAVPTGNAFLTLGHMNPCPIVRGIEGARFVEVSFDGQFVYAVGDTLSIWRLLPNGFLRLVDVLQNGQGGVAGLSRYGSATALSPDGTGRRSTTWWETGSWRLPATPAAGS